MSESILISQDLHKSYNGTAAVQGISFSIKAGEIFSLLGPNGAGKTTTLAMLSGLLKPTSGDALINGYSVCRAPMQVKQSIGVVPQEIALYGSISVRENLSFWGRMYGLRGQVLKTRISTTLDIVDLTDRAEDKVDALSGGMKRRLNIAVSLLHEPKLLYMDEPTVGIDPQSRRRILDTIKLLKQAGLTVLYTTHYMEEAEELSDRIGIIDHGRLIALGSQAALTQRLGACETIAIELELTTEAEALVATLQDIPDLERVHFDTSSVVIQTLDASTVLPVVVARIGQSGSALKRIDIEAPNLEAVFLHLTGRALRE